MRPLSVGRGRKNLGLVSLEQIEWPDLVALSSQPADADIDHDEYMALPKVRRNGIKKTARFISLASFGMAFGTARTCSSERPRRST